MFCYFYSPKKACIITVIELTDQRNDHSSISKEFCVHSNELTLFDK